MKVIFSNEGEIEPRAFSSFGINVKDCDSPIGFFGTGLKYAIAVLLREGCSIKAYSGDTLIEFISAPGMFRGKEFEFCHMSVDGGPPIELGFTTEFGKNWDLWCAYRELACNCIDEAGDISVSAHEPEHVFGKTFIVVEGESFVREYHKRREILLEGEPAIVADEVEIRMGSSMHGYYRGVRAHDMLNGSLYTYNVRSQLELTEDRTIKEPYYFRIAIAKAIMSSVDDERFLKDVLLSSSDTFEGALDYHGWGTKPSTAFLAAIGQFSKSNVAQINPSALRVWKDHTRKLTLPTRMEPSEVQQKMFRKAVDFCARFGFEIENFPIVFVQSLGEGVLGLASEGTIFVTERVFHQGTKQLASTLIEEYLHLKYGYKDCSRELQTYLFDRIVSMGEEIDGDAL
jgi:hypothetical protein